MIVNGCLVDNADDIPEDVLKDIFEFVGFEDGVVNEPLAVVSGDHDVIEVYGCDDDFIIMSDDREYRIIHSDAIDDIFINEASDYYDRDMWVDSVTAGNTDLGYDKWLDSIISEGDYGSLLASYDGNYDEVGDYFVFRTN